MEKKVLLFLQKSFKKLYKGNSFHEISEYFLTIILQMFKVIRLSLESLQFALNAVVVNKLRTLLSLLGITIGIFAIISVFTIFDSLEMNIRQSISSLGNDVIYVQKWPWTEEPGKEYQWWQYVNRPVPSIQEYEKMKDRLTLAQEVAFMVSTNVTVKYQENSVDNATFIGASEGFEDIRDFDIQQGRYFSDFELLSGKNYSIIGHDIAKELFGNTNPINKEITIRGYKTRIIGVFEKEGQDNFGDSMDESVLGPVNHVRNLVNIRSESMNPMIWVKARDGVSNKELMAEITMVLRTLRRLKPNAENNFALNQTSMLDNQLDQFFSTMNIAGWFIGIFSLLVGGFGIANIMFVSVKERTNIIGIQKALGAKFYFILLQFVFESVILALAGGIIGLLFVFAGTLVVNALTTFEITLTMGNIVTGILISSLIGLISGISPAYSAARLDPVDAINTSF
ncbi:MAG: ABC transporter permease [Bacteroidota bacterium]